MKSLAHLKNVLSMRISNTVVTATSGVFTPIAMAFIQQSINIMLPWLMVMFAVILTDLFAGIRKSHKLGIRISPTTAFRETFGKMIVYFSFVMMVAMIDVATGGSTVVARWACVVICVLEGGSILSNIMKPYGIVISPRGIIKAFIKRTPLGIGDEEADEIIKVAEEEDRKWNTRQKSHPLGHAALRSKETH